MHLLILWFFLAKPLGFSEGAIQAMGPYPTEKACIIAQKDLFAFKEGIHYGPIYNEVPEVRNCFPVKGVVQCK